MNALLKEGDFRLRSSVSVIIPAYNAEKTLKRCLDSVFAQDFDSFEVILVNDGSTDDTHEVARSYEEYPNSVLIDQPNGGVARARWAGIVASKGDYLAFVDSDDYIARDMLSKMYSRALETGAEIVVCGINEIGGNRGLVRNFEVFSENGFDASLRFFKGGINGTLFDKMFKKEIILEKEYKNTLDLAYGEDALLISYLISRAKRVSYLNEKLYYRVNNPNSVTRNPSLKALEDYVKARTMIFSMSRDLVEPSLNISISSQFLEKMITVLRTLNRMEQNSHTKNLKKSIHEQFLNISIIDFIKAGEIRYAKVLLLERLGLLQYFTDRIWLMPLRWLKQIWRKLWK